MTLPTWIHFWQRPFPSGNVVLLGGKRPLLVDSGYGSDVAALEVWLRERDFPPNQLQWLFNTHYHSDHVGGNHHLQKLFGVRIAAHRWDGLLINQGDKEAWGTRYLDQWVDAYQVDWLLEDGEVVDLGGRTMQVMHTPGHSLGHLAFYLPEEKILLCGDTLQANDVAWLNPFREGAGTLQRMMVSLEKLAALDIRIAISGHGPLIEDVTAVVERSLRRYQKWLSQPEKLGWHACKRIFAYKLMIHKGMARENVPSYLLGRAWFQDYSRHIFEVETADFVEPFLAEMLRSGAARWEGERLVAGAPHTVPAVPT